MIKKFLCWIWGHKTIVKKFTGEQFDTMDRLLGVPCKGNYFVWKKEPFCLRCGKDVANG